MLATFGARTLSAPVADLCLAYANTRYWRGTAAPIESLSIANNLFVWCENFAVLDAQSCATVREHCGEDQNAAVVLLDGAIAVREMLYRSLLSIAQTGRCARQDIIYFNDVLLRVPSRTRLRRSATSSGWVLESATATIEQILAPVLWSAGDLLAGSQLARLRCCANPRCQWLFLDDSKSGTRRWCSMASCGNRAKAYRHYLRSKIGAG